MYCKNCGSELSEGAKFCMSCGAPIEGTQQENNAAAEVSVSTPTVADEAKKKYNGLSIAGFIVSLVSFLGGPFTILFGPIVGIVLSALGLWQIKKSEQQGKGLAITGIILGALAILATIVLVVIGIFVLLAAPELLEEVVEFSTDIYFH